MYKCLLLCCSDNYNLHCISFTNRTSSRSDLISIRPLYTEGECSHQAIVSTISKEKQRNTAIVLAEDLNSMQVLRCDVILDIIDQLGVLTTTRELYLEEAPETFELWAQDGQGNILFKFMYTKIN